MLHYWQFWWAAQIHAWNKAWQVMLDFSPRALLRDFVATALAIWGLVSYGPELIRQSRMSADNVQDTVMWLFAWAMALGLTAVAFFGLTFVANSVVFSAYALWRQKHTQLENTRDDLTKRLSQKDLEIAELIKAATPTLEIEYDNEINSPAKYGDLKQGVNILPNGQPIKHRLCFLDYYIGVSNSSTNKTIRSVSLEIRSLPPTLPMMARFALPDRDTSETSVNIRPGDTRFFHLGRIYCDDSVTRGNKVDVWPPEKIEATLGLTKKGLLIPQSNSQWFPMHRNDNEEIELELRADDQPMQTVTFIVSSRTGPAVSIKSQPLWTGSLLPTDIAKETPP